MRNDILSGVAHRDLSVTAKAKLHSTLATANLTIESLARKPGMDWERRDVYRKLVLGQKVPDATKHEITTCRLLSDPEKAAIREVEAVKFRLLEGFVKLLVKEVSKKLFMAKWFTAENTPHLRADLRSEALTAFFHAVYRFNRYDIQFSTFLTTVVSNWLGDYCEKLTTIKLTENLKGDLAAYYSIRSAERKQDRRPSFGEIVRIIVLNELRDAGVAATVPNIEEHTERNRSRFLELEQATRRVVPINPEAVVDARPDASFEALLKDVTDRMTPLERKTITHKLDGGGLKELAETEGVSPQTASRAFHQAKEKIGAALAFAG